MLIDVPAAPVLFPLFAAGGLSTAAWRWYTGRPTGWVSVLDWAGWAYATAVLWLTFFPLQIATGAAGNSATWWEKANWLPVVTIDLRTFVLNIALFVPLGVLAPLMSARLRSVRRLAGLALATSAAIELTQFGSDMLLSSGRTADVNDLLANTLGAVLGLLVLRAATRVTAVTAGAPTPASVQPLRPDRVRIGSGGGSDAA